jgi:hypothetical protein
MNEFDYPYNEDLELPKNFKFFVDFDVNGLDFIDLNDVEVGADVVLKTNDLPKNVVDTIAVEFKKEI